MNPKEMFSAAFAVHALYAGGVAGVGMALLMRVGESLKVVQFNLPRADGTFFFGERFSPAVTYLLGLGIHMVTSIGFAVLYLLIRPLAPVSLGPLAAGLLWGGVLWLIFGVTASPVMKHGWFGSMVGRWVWLELLATHLAFGVLLAAVA